jgi:bifunctional DNA-binding transcriptional regulator/antitoxin component of YhaV-PrlF toxin-antitoxin module
LVKLQFDNNKQYKLTLPKALIDAKGWKKGSKIKIELDKQGNIVLKLIEGTKGNEKGN